MIILITNKCNTSSSLLLHFARIFAADYPLKIVNSSTLIGAAVTYLIKCPPLIAPAILARKMPIEDIVIKSTLLSPAIRVALYSLLGV